MRLIPDMISPEHASDGVLRRLNGASSGSTSVWDYSPGDYLLAEVREVDNYKSRFDGRKTPRLALLVEEGTEAGRPMPHHCHRLLACQHQELRNMVAKLNPRVGDALCLAYLGRDDTRRPARHLFRYSVENVQGSSGAPDF